jgi:hypothetical protein
LRAFNPTKKVSCTGEKKYGEQNCLKAQKILASFCQSILWWLALFKLDADLRCTHESMMQDLRVERHIM